MVLRLFVYNTAASGIVAQLNSGDNVYVAKDVVIGSTDTTTLASDFGAHRIDIYGKIVSDNSGIWFSGGSTSANTVNIYAGAEIFSYNGATVAMNSANSVVNNAGSLTGYFGVGLGSTLAGSENILTNSGTIESDTYGVYRYSSAVDTIKVVNIGLISGNAFSYYAQFLGGVDDITNTGRMVGDIQLDGGDDFYIGTGGRLAGTVFGGAGSDTIRTGIDNDRLDGGVDADTLAGGAGNDTYVIDNAGDKVIEATSAGNDLVESSITWTMTANVERATLTGASNINITGNSLSNTITGNTGNNTLAAGAGNDTVNGGGGNDKIFGSVGNDTLTGGTGNDIFVFNTTLNAATNIDTIKDFSAAPDTIWLENAFFTTLGVAGALPSGAFRIGSAALDSDDRIIYNRDTGALIYDANGSASGGEIQFAKLATGLAITSADFLII